MIRLLLGIIFFSAFNSSLFAQISIAQTSEKQNLKLKNLANQLKIPVYSLTQVNVYQIVRLAQHLL